MQLKYANDQTIGTKNKLRVYKKRVKARRRMYIIYLNFIALRSDMIRRLLLRYKEKAYFEL